MRAAVVLPVVGMAFIVAGAASFSFVIVPSVLLKWLALAAGALPLAAASLMLVRRPVVIAITDQGFSSPLRAKGSGTGLFAGRWSEVEKVSATKGVLIVESADGISRSLPINGLSREDREDLMRSIHDLLNTAHGYRRIKPNDGGGDGGI